MSKVYKIVHKETGKTLRDYLSTVKREVKLIDGYLHDVPPLTITYLLSEKGTPGFYYMDYYSYPCWLNRDEWRVEYYL